VIITKMQVYGNGTIRILGKGTGFSSGITPERGEIKKLSSKSRQRMVFVVSETQVKFTSMLTLTYPERYFNYGKVVKRHLGLLLRYLPAVLGLGVQYFWFIEFQARGAPHFHILINFTPTARERALVAFRWSDVVGGVQKDEVFFVHNRAEAWEPIRNSDGAIHYVSKYATKTRQKEVPERYQSVGRFWGCSARVLSSIQEPISVDITEEEIRLFLRQKGNPVSEFEYLPSFVFHRANVSRETIGITQ
jgi:hypothetical protein